MDTFAGKLQRAMQLKGIKQTELSALTGIGKSAISEYLAGKYEPKQKNIFKLARALEVEPGYFMDFAAEAQAPPEPLPLLTEKDERNIQKKLTKIIDGLAPGSGLTYYDDEQPMSDADKELLRISLENTLRLARQMAKQKFTPKKYRKP